MTTHQVPDIAVVDAFASLMANKKGYTKTQTWLNLSKQAAKELRCVYCAYEAKKSLSDVSEPALIAFISKLVHYNAKREDIARSIMEDDFLRSYLSGKLKHLDNLSNFCDFYYTWRKYTRSTRTGKLINRRKRIPKLLFDEEDTVVQLLSLADDSCTSVVSCHTTAPSNYVLRVIVHYFTTEQTVTHVTTVSPIATVADILELYKMNGPTTCTYFQSGQELSPQPSTKLVDIMSIVPEWKFKSNLCTSLPVLKIFVC